jgi:hypothetical protein
MSECEIANVCGTIYTVRVNILIEYLAVFTQSNNNCEYMTKAIFGKWLMQDDASRIMKCKVMFTP